VGASGYVGSDRPQSDMCLHYAVFMDRWKTSWAAQLGGFQLEPSSTVVCSENQCGSLRACMWGGQATRIV